MKTRQQITDEYIAALQRNDLPPCYRTWDIKPWFTADDTAKDSYFKTVESNPIADALIKQTGAKVETRRWVGRWEPEVDTVVIPERFRFYTTGHFYETLFRLLSYWAEQRVGIFEHHENRDCPFWNLVASLNSSFVCNELNIPAGQPLEEKAAWLQSFLEERSTDTDLINYAAEKANVIADFLLSFRSPQSNSKSDN